LSNPRYLDLFQYTRLDGRSENGSSDMVARLLYIGEDKVQSNAGRRQSITSELNTISWFNVNDKVALHLRAKLNKHNQNATELND
jgi:hypothetical protein